MVHELLSLSCSSTLDIYLTGIALKEISSKTSFQFESSPDTILTRLGIALEIIISLMLLLF
jgi:hypothetical protein